MKQTTRRKQSRGTKRGDAKNSEAVTLDAHVLRGWPLPQPDEGGDKEERGRVLVTGGAPEMPGAIILAAEGALRAGAGKLRIATCASIAPHVGATVPESRVFALPETKSGAIAPSAAARLAELMNRVSATLVGPGMVDERAVTRLMKALLPRVAGAPLILDAAALAFIAEDARLLERLEGKVILTPHAGEMARMLGVDKEDVKRNPAETALKAARQWNAVVALKGRETFIAAPGGELYRNTAGNVGLATSGSGDALAGVMAGLLARGAPPAQAAAYGVYLHARAGDGLAKRRGRLGYLARELSHEVPKLMSELEAGNKG